MRGDLSIPRRRTVQWAERVHPRTDRRGQRRSRRVILSFLFVVYLIAAVMTYLSGGQALFRIDIGNRLAAKAKAEKSLPF